METVKTTGVVATKHGSRYLQQLCKHWSHKFTVNFDPQQGSIDLPAGTVVLTAASEQLQLDLTAKNEEDLPRLKNVVASHLDRFAFREAPLPFVWE